MSGLVLVPMGDGELQQPKRLPWDWRTKPGMMTFPEFQALDRPPNLFEPANADSGSDFDDDNASNYGDEQQISSGLSSDTEALSSSIPQEKQMDIYMARGPTDQYGRPTVILNVEHLAYNKKNLGERGRRMRGIVVLKKIPLASSSEPDVEPEGTSSINGNAWNDPWPESMSTIARLFKAFDEWHYSRRDIHTKADLFCLGWFKKWCGLSPAGIEEYRRKIAAQAREVSAMKAFDEEAFSDEESDKADESKMVTGLEKDCRFLVDPEQCMRWWLSSKLRKEGLHMLPAHLISAPQRCCSFICYLIHYKILPASFTPRLEAAVAVCERAHKDLTASIELMFSLNASFNRQCATFWGGIHLDVKGFERGWDWVSSTASAAPPVPLPSTHKEPMYPRHIPPPTKAEEKLRFDADEQKLEEEWLSDEEYSGDENYVLHGRKLIPVNNHNKIDDKHENDFDGLEEISSGSDADDPFEIEHVTFFASDYEPGEESSQAITSPSIVQPATLSTDALASSPAPISLSSTTTSTSGWDAPEDRSAAPSLVLPSLDALLTNMGLSPEAPLLEEEESDSDGGWGPSERYEPQLKIDLERILPGGTSSWQATKWEKSMRKLSFLGPDDARFSELNKTFNDTVLSAEGQKEKQLVPVLMKRFIPAPYPFESKPEFHSRIPGSAQHKSWENWKEDLSSAALARQAQDDEIAVWLLADDKTKVVDGLGVSARWVYMEKKDGGGEGWWFVDGVDICIESYWLQKKHLFD